MNQIQPEVMNEGEAQPIVEHQTKFPDQKALQDSIDERYENIIHSDGEQITYTNPRLSAVSTVIYLILLFGYTGLLVYDSIIKWQEFDESDQYINGECPWGVIYILISLPTLLIQGAGYSTTFPKISELSSLIQILDSKFDKKFNNSIKTFTYYYLITVLLLIQYFSGSLWDAILNLVALEFLGNLHIVINSRIFRHYYDYNHLKRFWQDHEQLDYYQHNLDSIYTFFWELKSLNNEKYIQFDNKEKYNNSTLIDDLYKKIHDLYADLEHEPGFQLPLTLGVDQNMKSYQFLFISGYICGTILSKIYAEDNSYQYFGDTEVPIGVIFIIISLPILIIQQTGYSNYSFKEMAFFTLVQDYKTLCFEQKQEPKEFQFPYQKIRECNSSRANQNKLLYLSLIVLQYFSQSFTEAILNLCALEFFGNIETNLFQFGFVQVSDKFIKNQRIKDLWVTNSTTKIQNYNYIWQLELSPQELMDDEYNEDQLAKVIYDKLDILFGQLLHEDGYQFSLLAPSQSFIYRYYCLIIQAGYLAALIISSISTWITLSDSAKWINGSNCPWGVIYVLATWPIIKVQGIGMSEKNSTEDLYHMLKKKYIKLKMKLPGPIHFKWNDDDLESISIFNNFQENILIVCLYVIQFFAVDFYTVILNVTALEFMKNLDEHILNTHFRTFANYQMLKQTKDWKFIKIWNCDEYSAESVFSYLWEIKKKKED